MLVLSLSFFLPSKYPEWQFQSRAHLVQGGISPSGTSLKRSSINSVGQIFVLPLTWSKAELCWNHTEIRSTLSGVWSGAHGIAEAHSCLPGKKCDKPQHLPAGNLCLKFNLGASHMVGAGPKSLWETEGKLIVWQGWKNQTTWTAPRWYSWNTKGRWDLPGTWKTKRNQRMTHTPFRFLYITCHFWNHHWVSEYLYKKMFLTNSIWKMEMKNTIFHAPLCILHSNNRNSWPVLTSSCPLFIYAIQKYWVNFLKKEAYPQNTCNWHDFLKFSEV